MTLRVRWNLIFVLLAVFMLLTVGVTRAQDSRCQAGYRPITHVMGETCVPEGAERVVALEWTYVENVLALGIQPVGIADIAEYNNYVKIPTALDESVVDVGLRWEPNLEVIAGLNPDLIIGIYYNVQANYEELSAIAPTLVFNPYPDDVSISQYDEMTETFTTIATALGREEQAAQVLADMDAHFAQAQGALEAAGRSGEPFILSQGWTADSVATFRLFTDNGMAVQILEQIGLENAWDAAPHAYGFTEIGIEGFAELAETEFNFFYVALESDNDVFNESPLWGSMAFVQQERAYWLGGDVWFFGGPLSAQVLVDTVLAAMGVEMPEAEVVVETATCEAGFRLFDHEMLATDPVCIPEDAQRIVALDNTAAELLLFTDKEIVAMYGAFGKDDMSAMLPPLADAFADVPGLEWPVNLELLLELSPDLIVAYNNETMPYDQLSQIAPTVIIDNLLGAGDWKTTTEFWSEVFNVQDVYAEMVATYDARVAELQTALGEDRGETEVSLVLASSYFNLVYMAEAPTSMILQDVGLGRPEAQTLNSEESLELYGNVTWAYLSDETLNLADGDVIMLFSFSALGEEAIAASDQYLDDFQANPLWQSLGAVSSGNTFLVGSYWSRGNTYLLANAILDDLFTYLTDTESTIVNPIEAFVTEEVEVTPEATETP